MMTEQLGMNIFIASSNSPRIERRGAGTVDLLVERRGNAEKHIW
jgi:hypothetical protein